MGGGTSGIDYMKVEFIPLYGPDSLLIHSVYDFGPGRGGSIGRWTNI